MERRNEHNKYIREEREEREKTWKRSRNTLQLYAIGFIQQAAKERGNRRLFKLEIGDDGLPTLEDRGKPGRFFNVPDYWESFLNREIGDFVLVNPRKEEPNSYFMRLRMLDNPEYPHGLLQVVRCDNPEGFEDKSDWVETMSGVETPRDMDDSYRNLDSMVRRMRDLGMVTANAEIFGPYGVTVYYSHRDKDEVIKDYSRWVLED